MKQGFGALRVGDRVRYAESFMPFYGIVVDELTEHFVKVKWDDSPEPSLHRRSRLRAGPVVGRAIDRVRRCGITVVNP